MDFGIRDVLLGDLQALSSVFVDAYKPEKTGEHWTQQTAMSVLQYWFKRSSEGLKILAHKDEEVFGAIFADVKPWWDGYRMIDGEFFVQSGLQGKGIGQKLLREALERARDTYNITCFETITFKPEHDYPLKWYKKIGFEVVENLTVINGKTDAVLSKLSSL